MRITIATSNSCVIGGVETYVRSLLPLLAVRGHEVALLLEHDKDPAAPGVADGVPGVPCWTAVPVRRTQALEDLAKWRPDVVFAQGMLDPELDAALVGRWPTLMFGHAYYGTCVSGLKRFAFPSVSACHRTFGLGCLACYLPLRCGGLNPFTMARLYRQQARRLRILQRVRLVVAASRHMREEYLRHGLPEERVRLLQLYPTTASPTPEPPGQRKMTGNILFAGRLTAEKGARLLVPAVCHAARLLGRPLELIVAGSGPLASEVEKQGRCMGVPVRLNGWLDSARLLELMGAADVLLMPSLWAEPFGLVGIEAGCMGTPAITFLLGGIPDWLEPGVTGEAAPADPPTAQGLAEAIKRALCDPVHHQRLRVGVWEKSREFSAQRHVDSLEGMLRIVAAKSE